MRTRILLLVMAWVFKKELMTNSEGSWGFKGSLIVGIGLYKLLTAFLSIKAWEDEWLMNGVDY